MNHFTLAILLRFFVLVVEPQFGPLHCGLEKGGMDQSSRGAQPERRRMCSKDIKEL